MKRYTLKAPDLVTQTVGPTGVFIPDENGLVETSNDDALEALKRHGYTIVGEVEITPVIGDGRIDVEELGRGDLIQALARRGVALTVGLSREDLVVIANRWNEKFDGPSVATEAPAPEAITLRQPRAKKPPTLAEQIAELKRMAHGGDQLAARELEAMGIDLKLGGVEVSLASPLEAPAAAAPSEAPALTEEVEGNYFKLTKWFKVQGIAYPSDAKLSELVTAARALVASR